jgi:hypothetical protein
MKLLPWLVSRPVHACVSKIIAQNCCRMTAGRETQPRETEDYQPRGRLCVPEMPYGTPQTARVAILNFAGLVKNKCNYSSIFELKFNIYLNNDTKNIDF